MLANKMDQIEKDRAMSRWAVMSSNVMPNYPTASGETGEKETWHQMTDGPTFCRAGPGA